MNNFLQHNCKFIPLSCMSLKINWEAMGVAASVACAIHCALMPLLISSLPLLGVSFVHNRWVEIILLAAAFIIGISTLWHGFKKHHHKYTSLVLFTIGIGLFVVHQFVDLGSFGIVLVLVGITAIISAHFLNHRACRLANHCHTSDCNH